MQPVDITHSPATTAPAEPQPVDTAFKTEAAWTPHVPWPDRTQREKEKAVKKQKVFLPFLEIKDRDTRSQAELESAGSAAYQRVFGHAINGSSFRRMLATIIQRDKGRNDFSRLELYLDERPAVPPLRPRPAFDHSALRDHLVFKNPLKPTLTERQNALEYSFVHFEQLAAAHKGRPDSGRNAIKKSILDTIYSVVPDLAATPAALRRNWDRKYKQWKNGGQKPSAVGDRRPVQSGNFFDRKEIENDLQLITSEAWEHDGKLSIAIRKLRRAGKLSQQFINRYTLDPRRNKSHVARSIREEIKARLAGTLEYRRNQFLVQRSGPPISRDWSAANPGEWFAADDCSFNIVWWDLDDHGRPIVVVGEVLLFIDCRSLYPLGYILTPDEYNGETIRRGILHIHDRHGLPRRGFFFERGIWASRLLKGERRRGFLGWDEYEMGLRERGLSVELKNVTTPGAKSIETVFGIVQQNQRNERGFVGFNQRDYGQERLQKFIGRVRRGLVHPSQEFHSKDQWCAALDASLEYYMHDPQNGALLRGASPAEMFAEHAPLRRLQDDERALLSTHRQRVRVKNKGVSLDIRGQRRYFYNEALAQYQGRDIYAWFNIEQPDLLTVTDLDMKNPLSVKRHLVDAAGNDPAGLAAAMRDRNGFLRGAKIRLDNIRHPARNTVVRDNVLDDDAHALTTHIRSETEKFEAEQTEHARLMRKAIRAGDVIGRPVPNDLRRPQDFIRSVELWHESNTDNGAEQTAAPAPAHEYILASPAGAASPGQYWALSAKCEKLKGVAAWNKLRHQLTARHLGGHPKVKDMSPDQLQTMIKVFAAVLREASTPVTHE